MLLKSVTGVLLVVYLLTGDVDCGRSGRGRRNRRRYRCKEILSTVSRMVEEKLRRFEEKFPFVARDNDSARVGDIDLKLHRLSGDVHDTRTMLRSQRHALSIVREQVLAQKRDIVHFGDNFTLLEGVVKNLSVIVDHLQDLIPAMYVSSPALPVITPVPTQSTTYPKDCDEVYRRGGMQFKGDYYLMIQPDNSPQPFKAVCRVFNGSGWTLIQRRKDGSVNFFRNWVDYKHGFGNLEGEFWLGNDNIHYLTSQGDSKLRIQMEDWGGNHFHAEYEFFRVSSEKDLYRLKVRNYHGTAGDSLTSYWENHDGMAFSTSDRDNDGRYYDNCAEYYQGAWWFNNCFDSHLNGRYYKEGAHNNYFVRNGIQWNSIHLHSSLKYADMMVKPADVVSNEV